MLRFGELEEIPQQNMRSTSKIDRLATFTFRYRPLGGLLRNFHCKLLKFELEVLQANGIAPLPSPVALPQQNNKRKSPDTEERELSDEDEIERQVKELKACISVFFYDMAKLSTF